jgi:hypothetical protein
MHVKTAIPGFFFLMVLSLQPGALPALPPHEILPLHLFPTTYYKSRIIEKRKIITMG